LTVTLLPHGITLDEETRGHDKQTSMLQLCFRQHAERPAASGADVITAMTERLRKLEQSVMTWLSHRPRRIPIIGGPK
ncbi:hypothetical protein M3M33_17175, partial [Loigolactobacillus coryniformis]|uniref:hypothetical protein n=1 Tax=Loigolactobacillus coryniformis TaxID=1610 RepID=UPI00201ADFE4